MSAAYSERIRQMEVAHRGATEEEHSEVLQHGWKVRGID